MRDKEERVKKIVVENMGVDEEKVKEGERLIDEIGEERIEKVEMVMEFEEELGVEINEEDEEKIIKVGDDVKLIDKDYEWYLKKGMGFIKIKEMFD